MENKVLYHKEGVLASFPYAFELLETENSYEGHVKADLYADLKVTDDNRSEISQKLLDIPCIENSHFMLEGDHIIYRTKRMIKEISSPEECEVLTRRPFIEDYIEAAEDLQIISDAYEGRFLKTEFVY